MDNRLLWWTNRLERKRIRRRGGFTSMLELEILCQIEGLQLWGCGLLTHGSPPLKVLTLYKDLLSYWSYEKKNGFLQLAQE